MQTLYSAAAGLEGRVPFARGGRMESEPTRQQITPSRGTRAPESEDF